MTSPDLVGATDIAKLSRLEKAFLRRRACWLCEARLDWDTCHSISGSPCSPEIRAKRRAAALATYRPRQPKDRPHVD